MHPATCLSRSAISLLLPIFYLALLWPQGVPEGQPECNFLKVMGEVQDASLVHLQMTLQLFPLT